MLKRKGFTLIELLVVIAIIALLLAIILPAFAKVKMIAEEVICKSNLHQYSLATEIYSQDQQDRYPNAWASLYSQGDKYFGEPTRSCRWHNDNFDLEAYPKYAGPYWPYLNVTQANVCPTFKRFARQFGTNHQGHDPAVPMGKVQFSYSMNGHLTNGRPAGIKRSKIKSSPSETFLWSEENMWCIKKEDNTLLSRFVLNDNALLINRGNPVIDSFGSFHKISMGNYGTQMPEAGQTHGIYDSGGVNALMMDGSSMFATPEDSRRYMGRIQ